MNLYSYLKISKTTIRYDDTTSAMTDKLAELPRQYWMLPKETRDGIRYVTVLRVELKVRTRKQHTGPLYNRVWTGVMERCIYVKFSPWKCDCPYRWWFKESEVTDALESGCILAEHAGNSNLIESWDPPYVVDSCLPRRRFLLEGVLSDMKPTDDLCMYLVSPGRDEGVQIGIKTNGNVIIRTLGEVNYWNFAPGGFDYLVAT